MEPDTISILCDPFTREPLEMAGEMTPEGKRAVMLVNAVTGKKYPVRDGIPVFLDAGEITGLNLKYQRLYDRFASIYDPMLGIASRIFLGEGDIERRRRYLERFLAADGGLAIRDGTRVLEVSVGTGHNILALPARGRYYGLDISWGMLMRCSRNMARAGRRIELFQGNAEWLPFIDNSFDVVFHVGGINFFNDKARAIAEMARVARPGTKIAIADETEKVIKKAGNVPIIGRFYRGMESMTAAPVDLVPKDMRDVRVEYPEKGNMYVLTFVKPA